MTERGYVLHQLPASNEEYKYAQGDSPHAKWLCLTWERDVEDTINAMGDDVYDWIVVDHYGIDFRWHKRMHNFVDKLMVFDDLGDRKLNCNLLLDQTLGREEDTYRALVPEYCELMLGTRYALLRPEFEKLRTAAIVKRQHFTGIQRILIFMGGSDSNNITAKILTYFAGSRWKGNFIFDVVLGLNAPHIESVKEQAANLPLNINVLSNISNMAQLIFDADIAIGSGGASCWERCSLALPSLLFVYADNQRDNANILEKIGAVIVWSDIDGLNSSIENLMSSNEQWFDLQKAAADVCDGLGVGRVVNNLIKYDCH